MAVAQSRWAALLALAVVPLLAAACGGEQAPSPPVAQPVPAAPDAAASPSPVSTSELVELARRRFPPYWATDFSQSSVPLGEIISGGPPRDGIPPIYDPEFETVQEADAWLKELEPVIAVQVGNDVRAYSQSLLMFHEVANDVVGGRPIAITWCPLCNTSVVFHRTVRGRVFTFGVSGLLRHSDLIMWDHETESWWQQGTGSAIVGEMTGTRLEMLPSQVVTWRDFKAAFPQAKVLSKGRSTHGFNPYDDYDTSFPFLFQGAVDPRLPTMERVVGVRLDGQVRAYPYRELTKNRVVQEKLGERSLVIFYEPSGLSPLDNAALERSRSVGTATVFVPQAAGRELSFKLVDGAFVDMETGSRWNILGQAEEGPLKGVALPSLFHTQAFWFFWAAVFGETTIYGGSP